MPLRFERVLTDAVILLRNLPRGRHDVSEAQASAQRFRETHQGVRADLVADHNPALVEVDYDLLLGDPQGGTVALSWSDDDKSPWLMAYTNHWAANFVVTVNDHRVTAQGAILRLKSLGVDLMRALVNEQLITQAVKESPLEVSQQEIQAAADDFRQTRQLWTAAAMQRWLGEMGYSTREFTQLATEFARRRKLVGRITQDQLRKRFEAQRVSLGTVRFFRIYTHAAPIAKRLAAAARRQGLFRAAQALLAKAEGRSLEASLQSAPLVELPNELSAAKRGTIVGPVADESRFWVAEVLDRRPAKLDQETRARIRGELFNEWLAEQREKATVQWHWM